MTQGITAPAAGAVRAARRAWLGELRATLALAVPLAGTQIGQIAINTTDVILLGWLGPTALAAGTLGTNVFVVFLIFVIGVLSAVSPLTAQAKGAKDIRGIRRTVGQGLWAAVLLSLPSMGVLWHTEAILLELGQDPANAAAAGVFVRALLWGFPGAMGFIVLRSFISALSRPTAALVITLAAVVLNAVLNYGLVFGRLGLPRLELVGAGLGSSIVNTLMFAALVVFVLADRRFRRYRVFGRLWRPDLNRLAAVFRIGVPIGITLLLEVGMFVGATMLVGVIGTEALAAHSIAVQCASVTFMVPLGIGLAGTVRVGHAYGGGDPAGIRRAGWSALVLGAAFMAAMAILFLAAPYTLVGAFLDLDAPDAAPVAALAVELLAIAALFQLVDGAQVIAAHILRGMSDTRVPMLLAGIGYWAVGFPLAYGLGITAGLGAVGVWYGLAGGLAAVALLLVLRFAGRERSGLLAAPG